MKLIKMTAVERLKESDRGLREVYRAQDVSELLNYFYQLMREER